MKKIDYTIAGSGKRRTITPLTDRARVRTPESLEFENVESAKEFLKASQAEGYKFAGANLIDPEQKLIRNRYFFMIGNRGQVTLFGEDWGPFDTVWEVGDVMPDQVKNTGTEGIVEKIVTGDVARNTIGCDVAFILRLRDIRKLN